MRLRNIDLFKGLLILLVILGHVLQGKMDEEIWRTLIYSFHMPLFIGISGFLFNANKAIEFNLIGLLRNYLFRVILPWAIAIVFYFSLSIFQNDNRNIISGLIKAFINPYYHLWFIPGFLSWIIMTWIFKRIKIKDRMLWVIGLIISSISIILSKYPEIYQGYEIVNSGIKFILETFKPYYYFFFVLGYGYRNLELKQPKTVEIIFPIFFFILVSYLFYFPNKVISTLNFFVFNALMVNLVLKVAKNNFIPNCYALEWIGLNSLALYLWHVVPIILCKNLVGTENLFFFYSATILLELVFVFTYRYLLRINFLKKYVFGI